MGRGQRRRKTTFTLMTHDVVFLLLSPSPLHPLFSTNKIHFFILSHDTVRGRDQWFRGLGFGAGEHTGEDEIDAVELDDIENDDITEEETKRAGVDAASCNPKLPKAHGQPEPNRKFCSVPGPSSRTFRWIFAKMRHFVSHLSPGRGPFPSKFPNFGLQNVPNFARFGFDVMFMIACAYGGNRTRVQHRFSTRHCQVKLEVSSTVLLCGSRRPSELPPNSMLTTLCFTKSFLVPTHWMTLQFFRQASRLLPRGQPAGTVDSAQKRLYLWK